MKRLRRFFIHPVHVFFLEKVWEPVRDAERGKMELFSVVSNHWKYCLQKQFSVHMYE